MPRRRAKKEWREFLCDTCIPRNKKYQVCRWFKKVSVNHPYAVCRECGEKKAAVEVEEGEMVGVGVFDCQCGNEYTVLCRGVDTAKCYECRNENHPTRVTPGDVYRKTKKKHSCSRCSHGGKRCPNLVDRSRRPRNT